MDRTVMRALSGLAIRGGGTSERLRASGPPACASIPFGNSTTPRPQMPHKSPRPLGCSRTRWSYGLEPSSTRPKRGVGGMPRSALRVVLRGATRRGIDLRGLCSVSTPARRVAADAAVAVVRVLNGARMATAPEGFVGRPGVHDGNRSRRGLLDVPNDGTYWLGTPGPRTGVEPTTSCARPVATGIRAGALPDELPRLGAFTDATLPRRTW